MTFEVKNRAGHTVITMPNEQSGIFVTRAERMERDMQGDTVTISVSSRSVLPISLGCTISVGGRVYRMNQQPQVARTGSSAHVESVLVFEAAKYDLANVTFLLPDTAVGDYITADMATLANLIADNANRVYPGEWQVGSVPEHTDICTEQFTERNCLGALQAICEKYGKKFRIEERDAVKRINIIDDGDATRIQPLEYGHSGGLYSLERQATPSEDVVTRLYVYGSADNLPSGYRHSRLCLPNRSRNSSYVQDNGIVSVNGIKEGVATIDDVRPSAVFVITRVVNRTTFKCAGLGQGQQYGFNIMANWAEEDYPEWLEVRGYTDSTEVFNMFLDQVNQPFGSKKYLTRGEAHITWNTGNLSGHTFAIRSVGADWATIEVEEFTENANDPVLRTTYPTAGGAFDISVGDEIVISDIDLPMALVRKAEQELASRAAEEYVKRSASNARYSLSIDPLSTIAQVAFVPGDHVRIKDSGMGVDKDIRIDSVTTDLVSGTKVLDISDINIVRTASAEQTDEEAIQTVGGNQPQLTCEFTPCYNGEVGSVHISAGTFTGTIGGRRKTWALYERTITGLQASVEYAIWLKASKLTTYAAFEFVRNSATEQVAVGLVSRENQGHNWDQSCQYVMVGTISRAYRPEGGIYTTRLMELRYGSVTTGGDNAARATAAIRSIADVVGQNGFRIYEPGAAYDPGSMVLHDGTIRIFRKAHEAGMDIEAVSDPTTASEQMVRGAQLRLTSDEFGALKEVLDDKIYLITDREGNLEQVNVGNVPIWTAGKPRLMSDDNEENVNE